jgi:hypothetical protein
MPPDVRSKRAALKDVGQLHASANCKDGKASREGLLQHCKLGFVTIGEDGTAACLVAVAVAVRLDVGPAGEHQAVDDMQRTWIELGCSVLQPRRLDVQPVAFRSSMQRLCIKGKGGSLD